MSSPVHFRARRRFVIAPLAALVIACPLTSPGADADAFAANIRSTDPHSPAEQRALLHVPAGFEIQSVASEPDIQKPMNMAFDALGRLWVTTSREYPIPRKPGEVGRDRVVVFEDFGPDGHARKVTTFAEGLNIPTGVYPFRSPGAEGRVTWKAIVWSIPNIWLMEDTDGDGKADRRESLYGPFDHTRDTHGNQSSFRRGFDGWLYATHGYNNDSHVAGRDGHRIDLNSGNTYRLRLDGARLEQHTWGQVNPFGLSFDPQGNLWSSDCHSEPIYLLLRGGYYPSFGKPHDGLGFAPNTMESIRGSTAIDAMTYYADDLWPDEYRDCVFVGDVMTSRVYRDRVVERGSGRVAKAQPDLVVSEDPWFRPVDTTLGPDGALYIADFYNRIIGHYEVPLNHPGRDRERGRIWRVLPTGKALRPAALAQDQEGLVRELASPSLPRRLLAMNDLHDRFGAAAVPALKGILSASGRTIPAGQTPEMSAFQEVHALWLLERLGALEPSVLASAAGSGEPLRRIHAQRILIERGARAAATGDAVLRDGLRVWLGELSRPHLADAHGVVRRLAATALGTVPDFANVRVLLDALAVADVADTHLVYALRQSLRDQFLDPAVAGEITSAEWSDRDVHRLADVAVAARTEAAGLFLVRSMKRISGDPGLTARALSHAARFAPASELDGLIAVIQSAAGADVDLRLGLFRSMQQGAAQRGVELSAAVRAWAGRLSGELLASVEGATDWSSRPLDGRMQGRIPWDFEERACADGQRVRLMSSFPNGERLTGVLRSAEFPAPPKLVFHLCGHDGYPDKPAQKKNLVRLLDAVSGAVLAEAAPPRSDVARRIEWDLSDRAGKMVVLEAVDGDDGDAYAWLAFGRFEVAASPLPRFTVAPATVVTRQVAAAELAALSGDPAAVSSLGRLAQSGRVDPAVRAAAARAASADPLIRAAADLVADASLPFEWRVRTADVLFFEGRPGAEELIAEVWKKAPQRFQARFAGLAGANARLAGEMVQRMVDGRAPASLLLDRRLRDRLREPLDEAGRAALDGLVKSLPDEDPAVLKVLEERRAGYRNAEASVTRGHDVFLAACSVCHQIAGQGGLVGPQLTGIGTRGAERLCEDILMPNRNVDRAFWSTVLTLKDGDSISGLFRREEGELLVLANAAGAEFAVKKSDIKERRETSQTLMPSNFGDALPVSDFYSLLAYLLSQTGK